MESIPEQSGTKKNGGNKKKWILGSVLLVAILAITGVTMANTILARFAPDKFFLLSLSKMQKIVEKENEDTHVSLPDNRRISANLNLKDLEGTDDEYMEELLANSGLSFSLANSEAEDILIDAGIKKNGASLLDISIFSSENELGVKIPGVLDQYLLVDLRGLAAKLNASELSSYIGHVEEDEVKLLTQSIDQLRMAIIGDFDDLESDTTELSKEYQEAMIDLAKNANVRYGGSSKVRIDGKEKRANKISILIDSSHIKSFVKDLANSTFKSATFLDTLQLTNTYYTLDQLKEDFYAELDEFQFSDVEIDFIIDNQRQIVNAEIYTTVSDGYDKVRIRMDYTLSGGVSIFDQLEANLRFDAEDENISMSLEKAKSYSDKNSKTSEEISFRLREDSDQIMGANITMERDLKSDTDNISLISKITFDEDEQISFKLSGDLLQDSANNFFSLDANKIELESASSMYTVTTNGSGYFEITDIKDESLALLENQKLDLFSVGMSQIFDIIGRIGSQFYNFNIGDLLY